MHRRNIGICGDFDEGMRMERNARSMVVLWHQLGVYTKLAYNDEIVAKYTRNSCKHNYM